MADLSGRSDRLVGQHFWIGEPDMRFELKTVACPEVGRLIVRACMSFIRLYVYNIEDYELELALTEAVNNVVKHAYDSRGGEIEVSVSITSGEYIQCEVSDWGKRFVIQDTHPAESSTSGRGIYLMYKIADELDYYREGEKNTVRMRKYIKGEEWKI